MWFSQQLDPASPVYNTYRTWRVRGVLNVEALENALRTVVRRHSVLRARIRVVDATPGQVIDESFPFELPVVDLRRCSTEDSETICKESVGEAARTPFDLSQGPLFRAKLWRLGDEDYVLLVSMHHIVTDGWSFGVLYREISTLYEAISRGHPSPLPALPLQYGDYAIGQRDTLQGPRLENLLGYWKEQLAGLTPLQFPSDRSGSSWMTFRGEREGFSLGHALTGELKSLSQEEGVTLFTTLLTCSKLLLARYSGQTDVAVGTMKHGRTHQNLELLIGMFMNTLVLRSDLSGNPRFRDLLQRVRNTCKGAFAHEELPFDRLVDELHPERQLGRNPLFQVAVIYHNTPDQALGLPDLAVSPYEFSDVGSYQLGNGTAKFDLTLTFMRSEDEVQGMMEYSTDVLDRATVRRAIGHLRTLMEAVVADPERRIGELPLMGEQELRDVINMGSGPQRNYPEDRCIQDVFAQQVARIPQATAVVFEDRRLSYGELDMRANQLARYLRRRGIGPEIRVGLCLDRSIEAIVAVLGIFKAGGAYVPMDPDFPQERLAAIAKDADLRVILTAETFRKRLSHAEVECIRLDTDWPAIGREEESEPESRGSADSLAYVIFTSGSTGRPKGVEVEHRQVLNYVEGILEQLRLPAGSSFAMVSPLTADLGHTMLYPALATGGTLHILAEDRAMDPPALGAYFRRHRPDCLKIVPSHLATLLTDPAGAAALPEQYLILGGEACSWDLVDSVRALKPGCSVINHYGPTETTVGVTTHPVGAGPRTTGGSPTVPIGRPLPNSEIFILDAHGNPVPVGLAGEVYIGGEGLARGYAGAPELTAERFVPHFYSEEPGARLYRTGDRARFRAEGTIEFLGRIDHQVKLRGFRIELGEIETALNRHERVHAAVVVVHEREGGEKHLVAYVVPAKGPLAPGDLRQFLRQTLPEYMVPAVFEMLEDLPLLPNGKVDRRRLPVPDRGLTGPVDNFVAPRNAMEATLTEIWQTLLGVERVGVNDNFFELGGHSLLATRVVSRVRQELHVNLLLRHFLNMPTIAELAEGLEGLLWISAGRPGEDEAALEDREEGGI